jgi:hypothetical protein
VGGSFGLKLNVAGGNTVMQVVDCRLTVTRNPFPPANLPHHPLVCRIPQSHVGRVEFQILTTGELLDADRVASS